MPHYPLKIHLMRTSELADQKDRPESSEQSKNGQSTGKLTAPSASLGARYGLLIYRLRWAIIVLWIFVAAGTVPLALSVTNILHNNGYIISKSESNQAAQVLTTRLHQPEAQILMVFQASHMLVSDPAYHQEVTTAIERVRTFAHVISVREGETSRDQHKTVVYVGFDEDRERVAVSMPAFRQRLASVRKSPVSILLTGDPVIIDELPHDAQAAAQFAEVISLPVIFVVLLLVFGSAIAALMPVITASIAVSVALSIVYAFALCSEMNIFVFDLVSIIGLGLSVDYSLLIVRRFREELERGYQVREALAITTSTAGEAIFHSSLVVIIGFAGLLWIGIGLMTSYGIGGMAVAASSVLVATTLLPALLSVLGTRINALRLPFSALALPIFSQNRRPEWQPTQPLELPQRAQSRWQTFALMVMKRPVVVMSLVLGILFVLGWPARTLNPSFLDASMLPADSEARQAYELLNSQFPSIDLSPVLLTMQTPDHSTFLRADHLSSLQSITQWISTQPHVTRVVSLIQPPQVTAESPLMQQKLIQFYLAGTYRLLPPLASFAATWAHEDTTFLLIQTNVGAGSIAERELVEHLRGMNPRLRSGLSILVGGLRPANLDFNQFLYSNFLRSLIFILLATYILLLFTFRSVLLPLKALVMNVLSISAAYGALVFVFQDGHLQRLLGFTSHGVVVTFIPILMFCVLFGLSMDYEVFLLMRIREEWLRTSDNRTAVALGLEKTGSVITQAALLFMIVSAAFTFTQLIVTKELGLGVTIAVFVDATLIRCLLVPATMQLLGRWNWWFPILPASKRSQQ